MDLTGLKIKEWAGLHFFLEVLGKYPFPCLFPLLEAIRIVWITPPFLHFQIQQPISANLCTHGYISSVSVSSAPIFAYKDPVIMKIFRFLPG